MDDVMVHASAFKALGDAEEVGFVSDGKDDGVRPDYRRSGFPGCVSDHRHRNAERKIGSNDDVMVVRFWWFPTAGFLRRVKRSSTWVHRRHRLSDGQGSARALLFMDPAQALRVLLVDDDKDLTRLLAKRLQTHGFATEERTTGLGVINILAGWDEDSPQPDILVLDNFMPEISGAAIVSLAARTAAASHIPIILYSASSLIQAEVEALGHPQMRFILKDHPTDVIQTVLHFRRHGRLPEPGKQPDP